MIAGYKKGGDWILVAKSAAFGQLVRDILGTDSVHVAARKTGLSTNVLSQMRNDHVPGIRVLAQFMDGYGLSEKRRRALLDAAHDLREDVNPELMIAMACDMAGIGLEERLELLDRFRQLQHDRAAARSAA